MNNLSTILVSTTRLSSRAKISIHKYKYFFGETFMGDVNIVSQKIAVINDVYILYSYS